MADLMIETKEFKNSSGVVFCAVKIYPGSKMITDIWRGNFESHENFCEVINYVKEKILDLNLDKWLADLRDMPSAFELSKKWLTDEVMPKLINSGLKKEAILMPMNESTKLSVQNAITKINNLELKQFQDFNEAQIWIRKK